MEQNKIYHFHPITKIFMGESLLELDPIDKQPLIPANATLEPVIAPSSNQVAVFDGDAWSAVADYRGHSGFDANGDEQSITEIGMEPDSSWTDSPPFVLSDAIVIKKSVIRSAFNLAEKIPVTDENSLTWSGGYDSTLKIDGAKRMAEMAGLPGVELFDDTNLSHILTIAEAEMVVLTLGADYQAKFAAKQGFMVAVDNATDQAGLDAIVVAF